MASNSRTMSAPGSLPNRAIRVTIAYQDSDLRVASRKTLTMKAPPSDPLRVPEGQSGFWFQVEDASGRVLYRKVMQSPIRHDVEIASEDPERPLRRVPVSSSQGMFFLLVPKLPRARTVRVFSSPLDPEKSSLPAEEILRFDITPIPG